MLLLTILASLLIGTCAGKLDGSGSCPCLGKFPDFVKIVDCSYDWAVNGTCVKTVGLTGAASDFTAFPGDYGLSYKAHLEPGHEACFDITTDPPTAKDPEEQQAWCKESWCYIDPCKCDIADATDSDYLGAGMYYSYATCGGLNSYIYDTRSEQDAKATLGAAECKGK